MKRTKVMGIFSVCVTFALHGQELPDHLKMQGLKWAIESYAGATGGHPDDPTPASIFRFAQRNGISQDTVVSTARKLAEKEAERIEDKNLPSGSVLHRRNGYAGAVSIIVAAEGNEHLPFLEGMSRSSSDREIRNSSASAYIGIAGTDALPFVLEAIKDGRVDKPRIIQAFSLKLSSSKSVDNASLDFLCNTLAKENDADTAQFIDNCLAKVLQGYSNSVQRLTLATQFAKQNEPSENFKKNLRMTYEETLAEVNKINARKYWTPIKEEISKTPADKRTDLSERFKLAEPKTGD